MTVRIAIMVEGATEKVFLAALREFLRQRLPPEAMPKLDMMPCNGRLPTEDKLRRTVSNLLAGKRGVDAVIALTDVYTGKSEFIDAQDAKDKMRRWVGSEPRFYPHAAQHDFEAWLLPFWSQIQKLAGSNLQAPGAHPEQVNHGNPPAHRLQNIFLKGSKGRAYVKTRDAAKILDGQDLTVAANACPELKAFLNTILGLCGATTLEL